MLTLYYSPGASSLAAHIALEEAEAEFRPELVSLAKKQQLTDDYRRINPRARVPALRLDDGSVLTECLAILSYTAKRYTRANLLPEGPEEEAKCLSLLSYFASTVHVAYAHFAKPERYAADPAAFDSIRQSARESYHAYLAEMDHLLAGREWFFGGYSVCDPYALVFYRWGLRCGLPLGELSALTAHKDRLLRRPAVRRTLDREGIAIA